MNRMEDILTQNVEPTIRFGINRLVVVATVAAALPIGVTALIASRPLVAHASLQGTALPSAQDAANEDGLKRALFQLREAIDKFYLREQHYPRTLRDLVTDGFLKEIPIDPFTASRTSWRVIQSKRDPAHPVVPTGIFDVRSGSTRTTASGTRYSTW